MQSKIKIGVNPICWTNDDMPTLGGHISLETCLSEAQSIGFTGIEMGHRFPRHADQLYALLDQYQLALISGWYSARLYTQSAEKEWEAMHDHVQLLKAMDCDTLIFAETTDCVHSQRYTSLQERPKMALTDWHHYGQKLSQLASMTLDAGLQLSVHHHMGTMIQTQNEIELLCEHTSDHVGLVIDTGHLAFAQGHLKFVLDHLSSRITHVHCKDVRKEILLQSLVRQDSFLDAVISGVFTVPGDGMINFSTLINKLKTIHYEGWVVIEAEQYSDTIPAAVYAKKGFDTLQRLINQD